MMIFFSLGIVFQERFSLGFHGNLFPYACLNSHTK